MAGLNQALSVRALAITTSDTVVQPTGIKGIYVGGTGAVVVEFSDNPGVAITFSAVPVGTVLSICPNIIRATGTTATLMVALL
jgi:hypothetical protein